MYYKGHGPYQGVGSRWAFCSVLSEVLAFVGYGVDEYCLDILDCCLAMANINGTYIVLIPEVTDPN